MLDTACLVLLTMSLWLGGKKGVSIPLPCQRLPAAAALRASALSFGQRVADGPGVLGRCVSGESQGG